MMTRRVTKPCVFAFLHPPFSFFALLVYAFSLALPEHDRSEFSLFFSPLLVIMPLSGTKLFKLPHLPNLLHNKQTQT
jgi:hypothetical protein